VSAFYFTLSSLPDFLSGAELPTLERFLDMASTEASPQQLQVLSLLLAEPQNVQEPLVQNYHAFDLHLRFEVARIRAATLGWSTPERVAETQEYLTEKVRAAVSQETPLLAEEALDRIRDCWLEDQANGKTFEWEHLLSYFLRLQLWWKRRSRQLVRGRHNFETNYQKITQNRGVQPQ